MEKIGSKMVKMKVWNTLQSIKNRMRKLLFTNKNQPIKNGDLGYRVEWHEVKKHNAIEYYYTYRDSNYQRNDDNQRSGK